MPSVASNAVALARQMGQPFARRGDPDHAGNRCDAGGLPNSPFRGLSEAEALAAGFAVLACLQLLRPLRRQQLKA
jgi:hypothetical protein